MHHFFLFEGGRKPVAIVKKTEVYFRCFRLPLRCKLTLYIILSLVISGNLGRVTLLGLFIFVYYRNCTRNPNLRPCWLCMFVLIPYIFVALK